MLACIWQPACRPVNTGVMKAAGQQQLVCRIDSPNEDKASARCLWHFCSSCGVVSGSAKVDGGQIWFQRRYRGCVLVSVCYQTLHTDPVVTSPEYNSSKSSHVEEKQKPSRTKRQATSISLCCLNWILSSTSCAQSHFYWGRIELPHPSVSPHVSILVST